MAFTRVKMNIRLTYDPLTGEFTRSGHRAKSYNGVTKGSLSNKGYYRLNFQGRLVLAHRLAWFLTYGEWPTAQLDHANCDPTDNRLSNLRLATPSQQSANRRSTKNSNGYKGVFRHRGKFAAQLWNRGKAFCLGHFETARDAHIAYCLEALEQFGEFARFA